MNSSQSLASPLELIPEPHERIWGSNHLEPWFGNSTAKIGEIWFRQPESPVLIKFLFATENLSVQVHPDDAMAQRYGHARGKTEMWHILRAEPNAQIALGFQNAVTRDQIRLAAADASIMGLLRWIPVRAGESWFIPAGAVHAIGAGVTLCEVQQNSDLTYRLYDFGRGRELHMERSLEATDLSFVPEPPRTEPGVQADCAHFQVNRLDLEDNALASPASIAIVLAGHAQVLGHQMKQGQVTVTAGLGELEFTGNARLLTVLTRTSTDLNQARSRDQY